MSQLARESERRRSRVAVPVSIWIRTFFTILTLIAAVSLLAATLATLRTSAVNPGGTFTAGSLILSNQVAGRNPCLSSGPVVSCDKLFDRALAPGKPALVVVTIKNEGAVPAETLSLWAVSACTSGAVPGPFSGSGDLCRATWLTIHDDAHDFCYYPTSGGGACTASPSGTLADFTSSYGPTRRLSLSIDRLGGGIPYSIGVEIDPGASNELQGRAADFTLSWQVAQG